MHGVCLEGCGGRGGSLSHMSHVVSCASWAAGSACVCLCAGGLHWVTLAGWAWVWRGGQSFCSQTVLSVCVCVCMCVCGWVGGGHMHWRGNVECVCVCVLYHMQLVSIVCVCVS